MEPLPQTALVAAGLAGLLGGLHCAAMCGGYVAALSRSPASGVAPLRPAVALRRRLALAHLGRLSTYSALGALFGAAGGTALAAGWMPVQRALYVAANLLLLLLAVSVARGEGTFAVLERLGLRVYTGALPVLQRLTTGTGAGSSLGLGLLWGLTPCGLVYGVLPVAMLSGGALSGALVMLAFGIGTLPNLLAAGWVAGKASARFGGRGPRLAAAAVIAAFAAAGLWRALFAAGPMLNGPFCIVH